MKITYKTTFADYKAAYRMQRRRTLFLRYDQFIWPLVALLCLIVMVISGPKSRFSQLLEPLFIFSLWCIIGLPILRALSAYRSFRATLLEKRISPEFSTEIGEERIVDVTPGICELSYTWPSITGFGQDSRITVFCASGRNILFFPTSALNSEQCAELDQIVLRHQIKRWS